MNDQLTLALVYPMNLHLTAMKMISTLMLFKVIPCVVMTSMKVSFYFHLLWYLNWEKIEIVLFCVFFLLLVAILKDQI